MIGAFPEIIYDELLYSAIARFATMFGYSAKLASTALFGYKSTASVEFGFLIDEMVRRLPPGHRYSADRLIFDHTVFPYYASFVSRARAMVAYDRLRRGLRGSVFNMLHAAPSRPARGQLDYLRFCGQCMDEELTKYGCAAWHRTHQAQGVITCDVHGGVLRATTVRRHGRVGEHSYECLTAEIAADSQDVAHRSIARQSRWIAEESSWLMRHGGIQSSSNSLDHLYKPLLTERGWLDPMGRLYATPLRAAVKAFFSEELLNAWGVPFRDGKPCWPLHVLSCSEAHATLHHILMLRFLGTSAPCVRIVVARPV